MNCSVRVERFVLLENVTGASLPGGVEDIVYTVGSHAARPASFYFSSKSVQCVMQFRCARAPGRISERYVYPLANSIIAARGCVRTERADIDTHRELIVHVCYGSSALFPALSSQSRFYFILISSDGTALVVQCRIIT